MMLFKARQKAKTELERALADGGLTEAEFQAKLEKSKWGRHPFWRPSHKEAGVATNLAYAIA